MGRDGQYFHASFDMGQDYEHISIVDAEGAIQNGNGT
jgi:hypothetical protein